jgi:hypothetical protein
VSRKSPDKKMSGKKKNEKSAVKKVDFLKHQENVGTAVTFECKELSRNKTPDSSSPRLLDIFQVLLSKSLEL